MIPLLMPPMDTGIIKAKLIFDSNLSAFKIDEKLGKISNILKKDKRVLMSSISAGSEPGVFTMGKGKSLQEISMTIHYIDRFQRKATIWDIEKELRRKFWKLGDIKYVQVFDYGATPLSTIKGNIDVLITGPDLKMVDKIGNEIFLRCLKVKGLTSVSRSWDYDKISYNLIINNKLSNYYGLTFFDIANQLRKMINGEYVSFLKVENESNIKVRVIYPENMRNSIIDLNSYYIDTKKGKIPLSAFASFKKIVEPTIITREALNYSLDIIGYREKSAITHIIESFKKNMKGLKLPPDIKISNE